MTVYNNEKYLRSAIESILKQTYENFEFLIVNDGSTDKSLDIMRSYKDGMVKIINNGENHGLVYSRNLGIEKASGKYIAIMDGDDISLPKRLETQVAFMESHPEVGACGSWIKTIGTKKHYTNRHYTDSEKIKANLLFYTSLAQPSVMLRKEILQKYNLNYDKENQHCEDYGLWVDVSCVSKLANIPEVLLLYRVHQKGYSKEHRNEGFTDATKLREKQLLVLGLYPSKEDLRIHSAFFPKDGESTIRFLEKTEKWYQKIRTANTKTNKYSPNALGAILYERWRTVCGFNTKGGISVWKKYQTSPLWKIGGKKKYWDSVKILIKSIIKK